MYPSFWNKAWSRGSNSGRSSSPTEPPQRTLAKSPANMLPELDLAGSVVPTVTLPYSSGRPTSLHWAPDSISSTSCSMSAVSTPPLWENTPSAVSASATAAWVYSTMGVLKTIWLFSGEPSSPSNSSRAVWLEGNRKSWPARSRVVTISMEPARL